MIKTVVKLMAYRRAPAATFAALHPLRTIRMLGSGFVALPVGIWLGRKLAGPPNTRRRS